MSRRHYSRRRLTFPPLGAVVIAVAGIGIGIAGSAIWPWGFAPPPPLPERPPAVGDVICLDGDCAFLAEVIAFGDDRIAVLIWLRGKHGRDAYRVTDCDAGEGVVYALADERRRQRWERDGSTIMDRIAEAACGPAVTS